jgi:hypothetical protein
VKFFVPELHLEHLGQREVGVSIAVDSLAFFFPCVPEEVGEILNKTINASCHRSSLVIRRPLEFQFKRNPVAS